MNFKTIFALGLLFGLSTSKVSQHQITAALEEGKERLAAKLQRIRDKQLKLTKPKGRGRNARRGRKKWFKKIRKQCE